MDYAVEEIKKQAAKVGANVIVISQTETSKGLRGISDVDGATIFSRESEIVGLSLYCEL